VQTPDSEIYCGALGFRDKLSQSSVNAVRSKKKLREIGYRTAEGLASANHVTLSPLS
jgi:hypothetical protein